MLDWDSFLALHFPPSPDHGPIRLTDNLTQEELQQSAIARNALILLREAGAGPGLKMTATGNLSRAVVAKLIVCTEWPGFDNEFHLNTSR